MASSTNFLDRFSIGYFFPQYTKSCDYCSNKNDFLTAYGLRTSTLRVEDYQNMIDRGWRRSGKYCYKIVMDKSCCPQYTIRCAALDFKLSKTQKKILKKFNNFLISGKVSSSKIHKSTEIVQPMDLNFMPEDSKTTEEDCNLSPTAMDPSASAESENLEEIKIEVEKNVTSEEVKSSDIKTTEKPIKNKQMKAKQMRIQRKRQKLENMGLSEEEICRKLTEKKKYPVVKTIEDILKQSESMTSAHKLKISLVRSSPRSESFNRTFDVSFDLFKRYQIGVHKEEPFRVTEKSFEHFLVKSPLKAKNVYGSYHQQYWLDDKLIAVGVIDILPKCVSSVYFFYDPEYSYLCLGTYGALRELEFTRKLSKCFPDLIYYYMGFYIHTCKRMKYKAAFKPSYLLCPEAYTWHSIEKCLPKIDVSKYSRLDEDLTIRDLNSIINPDEVFIFHDSMAMTLSSYLKKNNNSKEELDDVMECAQLLGKNCARNMLLIRE